MEINIRLAGAAGQGIQTAADLLGKALTRSGLWVRAWVDAESRIRGGLNFSHLRCSAEPRRGVTERVDLLIALTEAGLVEYGERVGRTGAVLTAGDWPHPKAAPIRLDLLAEKAGSPKTAGTAAAAVAAGLAGVKPALFKKAVKERFGGSDKLLALNLAAAEAGLAAAAAWAEGRRFSLEPTAKKTGRIWVSGAQAIALGALAGGASFVAGYPMSPATGTLSALADWAAEAGLVVVQAEDEVAAINMVAGASYAGARSMTATSGGGFCLMTEGVSLLGMIESPAVIVLAQRPGPATGLPTRVAQGDLNLVRHAGHGFFPRIILAARDIEDCFGLTAQAFDLAEKYQVPVFVLTDQLLQDGQAGIEPFETVGLSRKRYFLSRARLKQLKAYRRYAWSDDGLSPLAAPGVSGHVVVVDSDEHDEAGHITESAEIAARMAAKRKAKAETVARAAWPLEVTGKAGGRPLVVSWGSSYPTVNEALDGLAAAHVHLRWLWPLPRKKLRDLVARASRLVVVENSVGVELASVIEEVGLKRVDAVIDRTDGRPFTVEELGRKLKKEVR